jgi:hypothetical protein
MLVEASDFEVDVFILVMQFKLHLVTRFNPKPFASAAPMCYPDIGDFYFKGFGMDYLVMPRCNTHCIGTSYDSLGR